MTHAHSRTPIHARRMRNILLGISFFVLGVIGILIPVMPQIVFFFLSALFFSMVSPPLRRALRRFRQKQMLRIGTNEPRVLVAPDVKSGTDVPLADYEAEMLIKARRTKR